MVFEENTFIIIFLQLQLTSGYGWKCHSCGASLPCINAYFLQYGRVSIIWPQNVQPLRQEFFNFYIFSQVGWNIKLIHTTNLQAIADAYCCHFCFNQAWLLVRQVLSLCLHLVAVDPHPCGGVFFPFLKQMLSTNNKESRVKGIC